MKLSEKIIRIFAIVILTFFIFSVFVFFLRFFIACDSAKKVQQTEDFECAHLLVYGSSENSVSASIELLDLNHEVLAVIERSWSSQSIYIEFVSFLYENKTFTFPNRIFSSGSLNIQSGIHLKNYFGRKFYNSKYLNRIAKFAVNPPFRVFSKYIKFTQIPLSSCIPYHEYSVKIKKDGSVELYESY